MKHFGNFCVPEGWADITADNLLHINEITDTSVLSLVKLVKVFNPDKDPLELSFEELTAVCGDIFDIVMNPPTDTPELDSYEVDGVTYRIATPENIDFQQFIDVNTLRSDDYRDQIKNMPLIMSIITENRPDGVDVKDWASEIASKVSVERGLANLLFFSRGLQPYMESIRHFLADGRKERTTDATE